MPALYFTHVSVHADDLEASARFYEDVFGMERVPAPDFPDTPVIWLRLGGQQLHLFRRETGTPRFHHFGLHVDDFHGVHRRVRELGILDDGPFGAAVRELPDGALQMYVRDPAGNLVEVNWPDAGALDRSLVPDVVRLVDQAPQSPEALRATLYPGKSAAS